MIRFRHVAAVLMVVAACPAFGAEPVFLRFEQIPTFDEPNPETLGLALAINELGEVVGIADDSALVVHGFRYAAGEFSEIVGFGAQMTSHPRAINGFGDIAGGAGHRVSAGGQSAIVTVPFIQPSGEDIRSLLTADEIASGLGGMAFTLNDTGVVGFEGPGAMVALANGERLAWGFPDGGVIATGSINQLGRLVGTGLRAGGAGFEALLYNIKNRTVVNLHDPRHASLSFAVDVNNGGVAVGEWHRLDNNRTVPVLWRKGPGQQLPFVNEERPGWIGRAIAINDRGDVLGESSNANGERVDWLLFAGQTTPVAILDLVDAAFFQGFDDFMAFDLNNSREIAGAAIVRDPDHPLGSTNKPGLLRPIKAQVPAFPAPGLWADPLKPGSGFEINRVGERHYLIWYTFDQAGLPVWYFSETVRLLRDGWRAELLEFTLEGSGAISSKTVGQVVLSHRRLTRMLFSWRLGGRSGTHSYRYLAGPCEAGAHGYTGTWHDPAEPGFGVSLQDVGERQTAVFYFYDRNGRARWAELDFPAGPGETEAWLYHHGACPSCKYTPPQRSNIGTARLGLGPQFIDLGVDLAGSGDLAAMAWHSDNRMSRIPSTPSCHEHGLKVGSGHSR